MRLLFSLIQAQTALLMQSRGHKADSRLVRSFYFMICLMAMFIRVVSFATSRFLPIDEKNLRPKRLREINHAKKITPPVNAEFLFYLFMTPQNRDALVGDMEQRYRLAYKKFGKRRADFWFWFQTFISLRPIIWAAVKRVSGVVALIEAYRRIRS